MRNSIIILSVILIVAAAAFAWLKFSEDGPKIQLLRQDFQLPSGQTEEETIVIKNGQVSDTLADGSVQPPTGQNRQKSGSAAETKKIMVTDGVRHSVPLEEIVGGGPPKDGIPSIDEPKFIPVAEASDFLADTEPGIALELNGTNRFYPFQILVWHEIVNDTISGQRVLVTYCPLCLSGIVFDPLVKDQRVEFGTSGKLWNSNLVMYDRETDSLWSQILGQAILGEMTGSELKILPSDQIRFGEWKKLYPDGEVLSRDTGATRFYGQDPYGDYYTTPGTFFPVSQKDNRLSDKDFVLGIVSGGQAKAYWPEAVKRQGAVEDSFAGRTIIARYETDLDVIRLFEKKPDGTLERLNPFGAFWFSWVAAHPNTELFK